MKKVITFRCNVGLPRHRIHSEGGLKIKEKIKVNQCNYVRHGNMARKQVGFFSYNNHMEHTVVWNIYKL